ncbi:oxaloacetate decarboxylase [Puniceibacterium sp. IMCC21224]|uniref:isocitrate lyase/PEP mutase family protein n=1 Tax=Puniceibacterium sp. IMCC21224 TaxID=1618204 RepID=UPI00064D781E|nr:isocitrate lyase/PEP mutase family protein [Puniceibacterium sp. IMCC21224]KMK64852.1 PEP phosphonomutase-like enzyme [Puniceibacterium sp. IMCC21224]
MTNRSAQFRALFQQGPFVCMGAHDALTAKLAEEAGAKAIYVSGFAASAIVAAAPDTGVLTRDEMFDHIRRVHRGTSLPIFADADTGYGSIADAVKTMQMWEDAGASVLHLEDQQMPKKCGHFPGKELIPKEEMAEKIAAMLAVRQDPDFFFVARTDAIAVTGLEDAIARLKTYAAAGADGLYADAPEDIGQMKELAQEIRPLGKPLLFNMARSGKSPVLTMDEAYALGFDYCLCPIEPMLTVHKAVGDMMRRFMASPSTDTIASGMTDFHDFNRFVGEPTEP